MVWHTFYRQEGRYPQGTFLGGAGARGVKCSKSGLDIAGAWIVAIVRADAAAAAAHAAAVNEANKKMD